jgi:hypothetical protein
MVMDVFSIAIVVAVICGLVMVVGGIVLIYKGAMTLAATPAVDAITIEFKKQFRLSSQVPGLAFFIVGLLFVVVALWFCRPPRPIELYGTVNGSQEHVQIIVSSQRWPLQPSSTGEINGRIVPDMTYLLIEANAPGCDPIQEPIDTRRMKDGKIILGNIHLTRRVEQVAVNNANISPVPFDVPPLRSPAAYGVAK